MELNYFISFYLVVVLIYKSIFMSGGKPQAIAMVVYRIYLSKKKKVYKFGYILFY